MVVFASASRGLGCAVAMQQAMERRNRFAEQPLHVRIGVGAPLVRWARGRHPSGGAPGVVDGSLADVFASVPAVPWRCYGDPCSTTTTVVVLADPERAALIASDDVRTRRWTYADR
jgi:hypothetical protein